MKILFIRGRFILPRGWTWCVSRVVMISGVVVARRRRRRALVAAEVTAPARTNLGEIDDSLRRHGFVCVRRHRRCINHSARMALFVYAFVSHDLFAIIIKLLVFDNKYAKR